ncbi:unnamed protein product [Pocillopora meandrina]|uniref:Uncharacterized protein n=1 Tax=Pocillopora meandrina TaxID=46732 RepID=A0AAU9XJP4_9CNID|nr:unnamed protein product [Pocillopora meandrina]
MYVDNPQGPQLVTNIQKFIFTDKIHSCKKKMPYTIGSPVFTYAQVMWHMPESQRGEKGCYRLSMCSNLSETIHLSINDISNKSK